MGLSPYKRVFCLEEDARSILTEHVRSATVLSMLSQDFDCMRVPCETDAVHVVKASNVLSGGETVLTH